MFRNPGDARFQSHHRKFVSEENCILRKKDTDVITLVATLLFFSLARISWVHSFLSLLPEVVLGFSETALTGCMTDASPLSTKMTGEVQITTCQGYNSCACFGDVF